MSEKSYAQIVCSSDLKDCKVVDSLVKHILVPYDDSEYSNRAFVFALNMARKRGSSITVITIMYSSPPGTIDSGHSQKTIDKTKIKRMENSFEVLKDVAKKFGIPVETKMIMESAIVDTIVSYAFSKKVDLIVMGTRGRADTRRLTEGSVAMTTSQKADCPVTLVK